MGAKTNGGTSKKAPETIYLQWEDYEGDAVTWCADKINDSDTEYSLASLRGGGWVSVDEFVAEFLADEYKQDWDHTDKVLVISARVQIEARYYRDDGMFFDELFGKELSHVTMARPLPAPPQEQDDE